MIADFSYLDGKRIAVVLCSPSTRRVVRGTAQYVRLEKNSLLRIELDSNGASDGNPTIYISENEWTGSISPDAEHGCDHQIGISIRS